MTLEAAMRDDFVHPDEEHDQKQIDSMTKEERIAVVKHFRREVAQDEDMESAASKEKKEEAELREKKHSANNVKELKRVREEIKHMDNGKKVA